MEEWRTIRKYPMYEVSSMGRVRSYYNARHGRRVIPRLLAIKTDRIGYSFIHLKNEEGRKPLRVHRLVAEAFIPNPESLAEVNHLDENKQNNCVNNLEWSSRLHNVRYSKIWKTSQTAVNQYDLNHMFIRTWESMSEAARSINVTPQCIFCAIKGNRIGAGYYWEYSNNNSNN